MSGGSWDYACYTIHSAGNSMERWDAELADMLHDLPGVCHDCEWADDSDMSDDDACESIMKFKKKWFGEPRDERLKSYVDDAVARVKKELYALIGVDDS